MHKAQAKKTVFVHCLSSFLVTETVVEFSFLEKNAMERASADLQAIMSQLLRRAPAADAPVFAWPAICGPSVATRTRALRFAAGRLQVEAPDSAWRTQLAELEPRYRKQFDSLLGPGTVTQIEFVAATDQRISKRWTAGEA